MVSKFLRALNKQIEGLHDAAYVLAFFAIISHLLAVVRDRLFAHYFGASQTLDVYYAAFKIPDFIFVGIASMVSFFVLIPFIYTFLEQDPTKKRVRVFLDSLFTSFFAGIVLVSVIAWFAMPTLLELLFDPLMQSPDGLLLLKMSRIMLVSPIILGISNIYMSITQTQKRFFVYALSPVLYNLGIILGVLFLYPVFGVTGLAYGVVFGALLHMAIQIPVLSESGLMPRFTCSLQWSIIQQVVATSLPRTLALASSQAAFLVLLALASQSVSGSVAIFTFAHNLQSVPLSIIGISYSVAAFPTLAQYFTNGEQKKFHASMMAAVRHILFWSFPALVLFIVLRAQIVRTILGSGQFTWNDTRITAAVVALFVISLAAQGLSMLFIRGYYAAGRTAKPLVVSAVSAVVTVALGYIGVYAFQTHEVVQFFVEDLLRISGIEGGEIIMLAAAYSVGMLLSAGLFWIIYRRDFGGHLPRGLYRMVFQSGSASVFAGAATYGMLQVLDDIFDLNTFIGVFGQGFFAGLVGIFVGAVLLYIMKNRELAEVWETLHHKLWKVQPVHIGVDEFDNNQA